MRTFTSREFNQDTSGAKRAAQDGPVYITDRGRPSHVLLTFEEYRELSGGEATIVDLLAAPVAGAEAELEIVPRSDVAVPADLD